MSKPSYLPKSVFPPFLPKGRYVEEKSKLSTVVGKFVKFSNSSANDLFLDHNANGPVSKNDGWVPTQFKVECPQLQSCLKALENRFTQSKATAKTINVKTEIRLRIEYETQIGPKHVLLNYTEIFVNETPIV